MSFLLIICNKPGLFNLDHFISSTHGEKSCNWKTTFLHLTVFWTTLWAKHQGTRFDHSRVVSFNRHLKRAGVICMYCMWKPSSQCDSAECVCGAYVMAAWKRKSDWGLRGRRGNLRAARRHCVRAVKTSRKQLHEWHWLLSLFNTPKPDHPGFYSNSSELLIALHAHYWTDLGQEKIKVSKQLAERKKEREKDTIRGGHCKEKYNYSQEEVVQNCTAHRSLIRLKKESCSIFAYSIKTIQWVCSAVHTNNINYSHRWKFKDLDL